MQSTLHALVSALDDGPWCGTRPPHWPPRPHKLLPLEEALFAGGANIAALNPQPLPPGPGGELLRAAVFEAVRLYQIGQRLENFGSTPAETGKQMMSFATSVFDDTCGSVPLSVLIAWLLHHNPPPPPPWLEEISQVVTQLAIASKMEGTSGIAMQQACIGMLKTQVSAFQQARG